MTDLAQLQNIASALGISTSYWNLQGQEIVAQNDVLEKIITSFNLTDSTNLDDISHFLTQDYWQQILQPVEIITQEKLQESSLLQFKINCPENHWDKNGNKKLTWLFTLEEGTHFEGTFLIAEHEVIDQRVVEGQMYQTLQVTSTIRSDAISWGYHHLEIIDEKNNTLGKQKWIIVPSQCYRPELLNHSRIWGSAIQLYSLRSENDWGIGDFKSLEALIEWAQKNNLDTIGLNPLHALNLRHPQSASPYSPLSRLHVNALYLSIESIPEFDLWKQQHKTRWEMEIKPTVDNLNQPNQVNYPDVCNVKLSVLKELYIIFKQNELETLKFKNYLRNQDKHIKPFACFQWLIEKFDGKPWFQWPEPYCQGNIEAIEVLEKDYMDQIEFYMYLNWQSQCQLEAASIQAQKLPLGLYLDLAVGAGLDGYDVWQNQALFATDMSVGAPPDPLAPDGQNWGLPPLIPYKLKASGYQLFIDILKANMKAAKALRIDHVAGLFRLYWIPSGEKTNKESFGNSDGTYIHYNFDDLLGILALESHRNKCLIIGEDLGTIPQEVKTGLDEKGLLSYKVARWERYWDDHHNGQPYIPPSHYPQKALVTFSTHDTSTILGQFTGWLFHCWARLHKISSEERDRLLMNKEGENRALVNKLKEEGLLGEEITFEAIQESLQHLPSPLFQDVINALHKFMAKTPSDLVLFQFEDVLQIESQVNVPGTSDGDSEVAHKSNARFTNWRQRLPVSIESLETHPDILNLVELFLQERKKVTSNSPYPGY